MIFHYLENDYFSFQHGLELFPAYEGFYDVDSINEIGIKVDGTKPTAGYLINLGNNTRYACLKYKERRAIVENNVVTKVDTGKCSLEFKNGYNNVPSPPVKIFSTNIKIFCQR